MPSLFSLIPIGIFLIASCATPPPSSLSSTPFPLRGERAVLEVQLKGVVSPAIRGGELLWGKAQIPGGVRIWEDKQERRSDEVKQLLSRELAQRGVILLTPQEAVRTDSTSIGRHLFHASYSMGERERWIEGRDRKGRRASLLEVERCALVEGEGRWLITGETVRFPLRGRLCDRAISELRSDIYHQLAPWNYLLETTLRRAADEWLHQLHHSTSGRMQTGNTAK